MEPARPRTRATRQQRKEAIWQRLPRCSIKSSAVAVPPRSTQPHVRPQRRSLSTNDAIVDTDGSEVLEGIMDALFTGLIVSTG